MSDYPGRTSAKIPLGRFGQTTVDPCCFLLIEHPQIHTLFLAYKFPVAHTVFRVGLNLSPHCKIPSWFLCISRDLNYHVYLTNFNTYHYFFLKHLMSGKLGELYIVDNTPLSFMMHFSMTYPFILF